MITHLLKIIEFLQKVITMQRYNCNIELHGLHVREILMQYKINMLFILAPIFRIIYIVHKNRTPSGIT